MNALALLLWTPPHEGGAAAGLLAGLTHPLTGLDHVLAMLAVGLWGAQLGAPAVWSLPIAFPLLMSVGAALGVLGVALPGVELGIALSALVLGVLVAGEVRPRLALAMTIVAGFALFHGHAHGTELPEGASGALYSVGFVVSTGALHGAGIALGLLRARPGGARLVRALGGLVALGGLYFLWSALR